MLPKPRPKIDPALVVTLIVGCVAGGFVVRYASRTIPNRAVGGLAASIAGDTKVEETPAHTLQAVGDVRGVGFAPNGNFFVGDRDGLTVRDARGKTLRTFDTESNGVRTLAVSPSGEAVAAALSYGGEVRFFGASEPKPLLSFRSPTDQEQQAVAFSPDGASIAAGGYDKTVRVYRAGSVATQVATGAVFDTTQKSGTGGRLVTQVIKVGDSVSAVVFAPDGKTLAVATGPKATIYNAATGKPAQSFFADREAITALCFAPNGKTLAVGAASGAITVFETATGRQAVRVEALQDTGKNAGVFGYKPAGNGVSALLYAPDGETVFAALKSGIVQQSDATTAKAVKLYAPEDAPGALSLALSTDAKRAVVGYADGSVRVWNLAL